METEIDFHWNCEEVNKLLGRGWQVVLFQDRLLRIIHAIAVPKGKSLDIAVRECLEYEQPKIVGRAWTLDDASRGHFRGPMLFLGAGLSVAETLHSVTEKVVFGRLPDGEGGYLYPPKEVD